MLLLRVCGTMVAKGVLGVTSMGANVSSSTCDGSSSTTSSTLAGSEGLTGNVWLRTGAGGDEGLAGGVGDIGGYFRCSGFGVIAGFSPELGGTTMCLGLRGLSFRTTFCLLAPF